MVKLTKLDQRPIDAFRLLIKEPQYHWLALSKLAKQHLALGELKKLLQLRFTDGYHHGYQLGFTQHQESKVLAVRPLPEDPKQLRPLRLLELCNDYAALGQALGSWQGRNDNFEGLDYQPDHGLKRELTANGLLGPMTTQEME